MSEARESQVYTCQCKGCFSGGPFSDAPESWWYAKGLTPPRNCQTCRKWIKAQLDETALCGACSWAIPVSAKRKISFHKQEGAWAQPGLCSRCISDPASAKRVADANSRLRERTRPLEANERNSDRLLALLERRNKYPGHPQHFAISADAAWWQNTTRNYKEQGVQTIWDHVMRHRMDIQTSARLSSPAHVVPYLSQLAASTDGSRTVQFTQGKRMVKIDVMTSVAIIIDPSLGIPVTSFAFKNTAVEGKLKRGDWS